MIPYSETLPENIRAIVRRIADGGTAAFHTDVWSYERDGGAQQWLQALRDDDGSWTVESWHRMALEQGKTGIAEKRTILSGVCVFDALRKCAAFEREEMTGAFSFPAENAARSIHYRDAARKAGQPADIEGMIFPAAQGRILIDGVFDDENRQLAEATHAVPMISVPIQTSLAHNLLLPATQTINLPAVETAQSWEYHRAVALFNAAAAAMDGFLQTGRYQKMRCFDTDNMEVFVVASVILGAVGGMFAALSPPVGITIMLTGQGIAAFVNLGNNSEFKNGMRKVRKAVSVLPEGEGKEVMKQFTEAASGARMLEHAVSCRRRFLTTGKEKWRTKGTHLIDKYCTVAGLSEEDKTQLQASYAAGRLPDEDAGAFFTKIESQLQEIKGRIPAFATAVSSHIPG